MYRVHCATSSSRTFHKHTIHFYYYSDCEYAICLFDLLNSKHSIKDRRIAGFISVGNKQQAKLYTYLIRLEASKQSAAPANFAGNFNGYFDMKEPEIIHATHSFFSRLFDSGSVLNSTKKCVPSIPSSVCVERGVFMNLG